MTLPYSGPREDGPTCRGCGEFLTMDEVQGEAHVCRVSSNDLTVMQIALAQAGCLGSAWEVTPDGFGFVRFDDPLEARDVLRAAARQTLTPTPTPE